MKTSEFNYELPPELIAQTPVEPRHSSRLLVLHREDGRLEHTTFWQIEQYLNPGDLLVINRTRVIPARLMVRKDTGGKAEVLLLKKIQDRLWEAIVGGKRMRVGRKVYLSNGLEAEIIEELEGSRRIIRFQDSVEPVLDETGQMPLPPYIHTALENPERYQTVYAEVPGSAAAPTAGLHFTPELMNRLREKNLRFESVTLHVGLDTFAPVTEEDVTQHKIHTEWCEVLPETVQAVRETRRRGGRVIAVGTTSVRALESAGRAANKGEEITIFSGPTDLFILPGYQFGVVDGMITNFHLPCSTLLMLVSAFAGKNNILAAYEKAKDMNYRFYSFGDAMIIV